MILSPAMRETISQFQRRQDLGGGSVMPYSDEQRTFDALERRGLIRYQRVDDGAKQNGYVLTTPEAQP